MCFQALSRMVRDGAGSAGNHKAKAGIGALHPQSVLILLLHIYSHERTPHGAEKDTWRTYPLILVALGVCRQSVRRGCMFVRTGKAQR